jgi:TfoX/Sxy family transcriptional regulator of competence genes
VFYRILSEKSKPAERIIIAMAWKKSPPELIATFDKAKPSDPAVQRRPMFGYPALFLNGRMFAGTFQDKIVVKFGDDPSIQGANAAKGFEPMPGRPMTGFFVVPDAVVKSPAKLRTWVDHAHAYAKTLPAKTPHAKKPPAKKAR